MDGSITGPFDPLGRFQEFDWFGVYGWNSINHYGERIVCAACEAEMCILTTKIPRKCPNCDCPWEWIATQEVGQEASTDVRSTETFASDPTAGYVLDAKGSHPDAAV